ncbi:MAG TPA: ferredoxin reductase [Marmoricola sp.]|nr:ferredoxin reductase [Marmoricola sp.]
MLREGLTRVAEALATPLVPADYFDMFDPLRKGADLRGRIEEIHMETADAATIVIRAGADWAGHVPGQYVRIGVDIDGVRTWRPYSLTHGPRGDGRISVTVKAVPDGLVSNHLVRHTKPGTLVHLEQAAGDFVLPPEGGRFTFITAGSGITPVIGILRNLFPVTDDGVLRLERSDNFDIVVVHVAPSQPESIFIDNLRSLDEAGAIRLIARYDDQHGILDVNALGELVPDLAERTTYACGPGGLLDALESFHDTKEVPLQVEKFRATYVEPGEGGTVTFAKSGVTIDVDGATTLMEAAEEAGVLMPSGCRMGICFTCVLPLKEGVVRDLRNGEITSVTESDNVRVQTCINAAAGACTFDH